MRRGTTTLSGPLGTNGSGRPSSVGRLWQATQDRVTTQRTTTKAPATKHTNIKKNRATTCDALCPSRLWVKVFGPATSELALQDFEYFKIARAPTITKKHRVGPPTSGERNDQEPLSPVVITMTPEQIRRTLLSLRLQCKKADPRIDYLLKWCSIAGAARNKGNNSVKHSTWRQRTQRRKHDLLPRYAAQVIPRTPCVYCVLNTGAQGCHGRDQKALRGDILQP